MSMLSNVQYKTYNQEQYFDYTRVIQVCLLVYDKDKLPVLGDISVWCFLLLLMSSLQKERLATSLHKPRFSIWTLSPQNDVDLEKDVQFSKGILFENNFPQQ